MTASQLGPALPGLMGRSGGRDKPGGATPDWLGPRDPGDGPAPVNRAEAREEQKAEKKRRPKRDLDDDLDDGPSKKGIKVCVRTAGPGAQGEPRTHRQLSAVLSR